MESALTWQKAKERTQKMESEIAALIPKDVVVKTDQPQTGILLSCDKTQHNWNAATTITVKTGTDIEDIVRNIENHYQSSRFSIKEYPDEFNHYKMQLRSPGTAESYLIGQDENDTIRIVGGSACFTLPEGVYPGGKF